MFQRFFKVPGAFGLIGYNQIVSHLLDPDGRERGAALCGQFQRFYVLQFVQNDFHRRNVGILARRFAEGDDLFVGREAGAEEYIFLRHTGLLIILDDDVDNDAGHPDKNQQPERIAEAVSPAFGVPVVHPLMIRFISKCVFNVIVNILRALFHNRLWVLCCLFRSRYFGVWGRRRGPLSGVVNRTGRHWRG